MEGQIVYAPLGGVQSLPANAKHVLVAGGPTLFEELQEERFVGSVDFVTDDWVADPVRMHSYLMQPAGARNDFGKCAAARGLNRMK